VSVIKRIASLGTRNYPEITEQVFIVRPPLRSLFALVWSIVNPFLHEQTLAKVHVLTQKDFLPVLAQNVAGGTAALPRFLGGDADSPVCPALPVKKARRRCGLEKKPPTAAPKRFGWGR